MALGPAAVDLLERGPPVTLASNLNDGVLGRLPARRKYWLRWARVRRVSLRLGQSN
jgi:hypothetical protein